MTRRLTRAIKSPENANFGAFKSSYHQEVVATHNDGGITFLMAPCLSLHRKCKGLLCPILKSSVSIALLPLGFVVAATGAKNFARLFVVEKALVYRNGHGQEITRQVPGARRLALAIARARLLASFTINDSAPTASAGTAGFSLHVQKISLIHLVRLFETPIIL
jgi:hypothetical protein